VAGRFPGDRPPGELGEVLDELCAGREATRGACLKAGLVQRVGEQVLKLYERRTSAGPLARLKRPRAARTAAAHARLAPARTPAVLGWGRLGHPRFESFLVYEYVEGASLHELWPTAGGPHPERRRALGALPELFADLDRAPGLHGDLHAKNLIWTSDGWCVIDLDGVRAGIHALRRRALVERTWARLLFDFDGGPEAEQLCRAALERSDRAWDVEAAWGRIVPAFEEIKRRRLAVGIRPGD
jgi:hypothetical protein